MKFRTCSWPIWRPSNCSTPWTVWVHLVNLSVRPEQAACGDISYLEWDGINGEDWRIEYGLNPLWKPYPDLGVGNGWCTYRTCNQDTLSCDGYRFPCSGSFNPLASPTLRDLPAFLQCLNELKNLSLRAELFCSCYTRRYFEADRPACRRLNWKQFYYFNGWLMMEGQTTSFLRGTLWNYFESRRLQELRYLEAEYWTTAGCWLNIFSY